ncbi:hypothetical protein B0H14DRAFT_2562393 [Mycena olivaceomarginata]|nr:hypothetical protein B0H14DRAFT_2562393 [Mycena olivaceomarginata]
MTNHGCAQVQRSNGHPPSTPSRAADALLDLLQQMLPSKGPDTLRRLRRNMQSSANAVREDLSFLKRRVTDLEKLSASTARPRKQRKRNNRAANADDSIPDPQTIEERTREKGRHFVIQEALFLLDDEFDAIPEFATEKNRVQGQLRQILKYLPADVLHIRKTDLISGAVLSTVWVANAPPPATNRFRGPSLAKIVDDTKPFESSSARFNAIAALIGYQRGTDTQDPYYSKLDVPVLYDGWQGEKDPQYSLPKPHSSQACIIRGPNGADGLFSGKPQRPKAKTVERMYKIHCTTPGAIANAAVLAIWLHSADTQLVEIGDETTINYRTRHTYYLQHIVDALADDKAWAVALLDHWDHVLFPDVDEPRTIDGSTGNSRLEANEDNEDLTQHRFVTCGPQYQPTLLRIASRCLRWLRNSRPLLRPPAIQLPGLGICAVILSCLMDRRTAPVPRGAPRPGREEYTVVVDFDTVIYEHELCAISRVKYYWLVTSALYLCGLEAEDLRRVTAHPIINRNTVSISRRRGAALQDTNHFRFPSNPFIMPGSGYAH